MFILIPEVLNVIAELFQEQREASDILLGTGTYISFGHVEHVLYGRS